MLYPFKKTILMEKSASLPFEDFYNAEMNLWHLFIWLQIMSWASYEKQSKYLNTDIFWPIHYHLNILTSKI